MGGKTSSLAARAADKGRANQKNTHFLAHAVQAVKNELVCLLHSEGIFLHKSIKKKSTRLMPTCFLMNYYVLGWAGASCNVTPQRSFQFLIIILYKVCWQLIAWCVVDQSVIAMEQLPRKLWLE